MADVKENAEPTDVEILQPDRKIVKREYGNSVWFVLDSLT